MRKPEGAEWLLSRQKRAMDVAGAALLSPLLGASAIAALVIRTVDRMNPVFRQERLTRGLTPFIMYKLRSMPEGTPERPSAFGAREPEATKLGRRLRASHLDETPQLINVSLGQMSLVGFRPPIHQEIDDTLSVLSRKEQEAWLAAVDVTKGGVFSAYNNQLHRDDYDTHTLRARALSTIEYAGCASPWEDMSILADGLGVGIDSITQLFRHKRLPTVPDME